MNGITFDHVFASQSVFLYREDRVAGNFCVSSGLFLVLQKVKNKL